MTDRDTLIPEIGEGKRGVEGYLGYLLRQAAAASRLQTDRALADLGITSAQFLALTMINAYPGCSGADLARLALVTPQTMSSILAVLERSGRIQRTLPEAGRSHRLALTESGQLLLDACKQRLADTPSLAAELTPDEEAVVRRWLVSVARMTPD